MTGGTSDEPKAGKGRPAPSREARLAEALRANLRRRKAPAKSTAPESPPGGPHADPPRSDPKDSD